MNKAYCCYSCIIVFAIVICFFVPLPVQSTVIDDENADLFKSDILAPQRLLYSFTYILLGLGGGMFFGSIIALIRSKPKV